MIECIITGYIGGIIGGAIVLILIKKFGAPKEFGVPKMKNPPNRPISNKPYRKAGLPFGMFRPIK